MKNIKIYLVALVAILFSSCIKDEKVVFTDSVVEWDASVYNANAAGLNYPFLTRVPGYGRATVTTDPTIARTSGSIKLRINLVGAQRSTPTTVTYRVVALAQPQNPTATTPLPAVAGTHFTTSGTATIPANSSFGEVEVQIVNPGVTSTAPRDVVLEIMSTDGVKPSENDKFVGIRISQT
ncbi:hypothetical protein ABDD95_10055 [Mucilaginibacter sp. PAMB04274]|uniref:hypothetical protein n=1 Tax=Mucilaginibacter sp. PAMB04274 TaxID=3138568 RepID=UPI0031F63200